MTFRCESWRYPSAVSYSPSSLTRRQESRCPTSTKNTFQSQLNSKSLDLINRHVPLRPQVIKNLLFVGKVIYFVSPESDVTSTQEEVKEEEEEEQRENGHEEDEDEEEREEKEKEEDDKDNRPPSLLWLMKKLSLMAKREAANTPKVPLKVHRETLGYMSSSVGQ